ncbi:MAG: thiaminase II [Eggerthellaceae bacterium]|nr:thiaminase II [Eggerthellaceae bacterium]
MTASQRLIKATADILDAYNAHPFVAGIQNGDLDRAKFRFYIVQDYLYLKEYAKVFAVGVAKAKSLEVMRLFAKYIPVMDGELNVHEGYLARLGVTQEEVDAAKPGFANLAYTSYMLRVAYEEGDAETLAAILPCAYTYEVIGRRMLEANPASIDDPFYGDWVRGYTFPEYAQENKILWDTLDELTATYTEAQLEHLTDIYRMGCRFEMGFWDMAWEMAL